MSELLQGFCQVHGLDFATFIGEKPCGNGSIDPYRMIGKGDIGAIIVEPYGRFGNNVIQLINAIWFAKKTCLRKVYVSGLSLPFPDNGYICDDGVELIFGQFESPEEISAISGRFFFWWGLAGMLRVRTPRETVDILNTYIQPILFPDKRLLKQAADDFSIYVHVRGGDIFNEGGSVNPDYVQPPLSYYQKIIDDLLQNSLLKKVIVVYEDKRNPTIDALAAWLNVSEIKAEFLSESLTNDISQLLKAKSLIAGFGTFASIVGLMSPNLKSIYFFREGHQVDSFKEKGVSVRIVRDLCNGYISKGGWKNTDEQRAKMLTYPANCLELMTL